MIIAYKANKCGFNSIIQQIHMDMLTIVYNKDKCIGIDMCKGVDILVCKLKGEEEKCDWRTCECGCDDIFPNIIKRDKNDKAHLIGSVDTGGGVFELAIEEKNLEPFKELAIKCPTKCLSILDKEGKNIPNP